MKRTAFRTYQIGGVAIAPAPVGPPYTNLAITVTNPNIPNAVATQLVAANANRIYLEIFNGLAITIWVAVGSPLPVAAVGVGFPIAAGQSWVCTPDPVSQRMYTGIASVFQNSGAGSAGDIAVSEA